MMSNDYVGYGKPPKKHQFKKGQSGNPSGKRKPQSVEELVAKELAKLTPVQVDGKKTKMSNLDIMVRTLVRNAMAGDLAATKLAFSLAPREDNDGDHGLLTDHELKTLAAFLGQTKAAIE